MKSLFVLFSIVSFSLSAYGQKFSSAWEELTASDFVEAVKKAEEVCIVPVAVIEKHGQHLPLGTDVYIAREVSRRAAEKEYCVIYPYYFMTQNFIAMPQPGTIAYSTELMYKLLDETCREIVRNGFKKIILVNSHGGNTNFLNYFCQMQMESPKDYVVYTITPQPDAATRETIRKMRKTTTGGHADEVESSIMLAIHPELVKMERAISESGENQALLPLGELTGMRWYGQYPNHYAGDAKDANADLGELQIEGTSVELAKLIKAVKDDHETLQLQKEFFQKSQYPLNTKAR